MESEGEVVTVEGADSLVTLETADASVVLNSSAAAEVAFTATNEGGDSLPSFGLYIDAVPSNFTVVDQSSDGVWLSSDREQGWVWTGGLPAGTSVSAQLTLKVPAITAPGAYEVQTTARLDEGSDVTETAVITVTEQAPPDRNGTGPGDEDGTVVRSIAGENAVLDFEEVLESIRLFNDGETVPGTDGAHVDFQTVLEIIELFNTGESVSPGSAD